MTDRCEPPEHLRGVDGWHWVQHRAASPEIFKWWAPIVDARGEWVIRAGGLPERMAERGYRYLAPVATPEEVAALRAENEQLRLAIQAGEDAPGHAASIPIEVILSNAQKLHADAAAGWDVATLRARVEALEAAMEEYALWHEAADKALSKQPNGGDRMWRRMQHQEQLIAVRAALERKP